MKQPIEDLIHKAQNAAQQRIRDGRVLPAVEGAKTGVSNGHDVKLLPPADGEPPLAVPAAAKHGNGITGRTKQLMARDERYRQFAREYFFSGHNAAAAYAAVGYSCQPKHMPGHIAKLMKQAIVQDELTRLGAVAREVLNAKAINITEFWHEICAANIFDFIEQNSDGTVSVRDNLQETLTPGQQRAVKKIRVRRQIYRNRDESETETIDTEIELWDRIAALRNVGEIQGLYKANKEDLADFAAILTQRLTGSRDRLRRTFDQSGDLLAG